jgi:hypothetical protein
MPGADNFQHLTNRLSFLFFKIIFKTAALENHSASKAKVWPGHTF